MSNTSEDKQKVVKGILVGWIFSTIFIGLGFWFSQVFGWFSNFSAQQVLSITLAPPCLSLAAGVGWAARTRHVMQNIDGSPPNVGTPLEFTLRYIRNTMEQVILFLMMTLCLLGATPQFAIKILPILGLWFLISRILFWVGYRQSPLNRAIGFASTFHPTILFLLVGCIAIITKI